jgi:hypothetical protein
VDLGGRRVLVAAVKRGLFEAGRLEGGFGGGVIAAVAKESTAARSAALTATVSAVASSASATGLTTNSAKRSRCSSIT